jgi:hypothetical protein
VFEVDRGPHRRTYAGEEECRALANWLNQNGQTPAGLRIQSLLTFAHVLSQAAPVVVGDREARDLKEVVSSLHRAWKSLPHGQGVARAESLRRLAKSVGVPKVRVRVKVKFAGAGPARRLFLVLAADSVEGEAVLSVLRLSQKGILDRVRKCPCCGRWFFARFRHQHFCETKCQQKQYRTSESWKAHRREWAREYYRTKLKPNVK